MSLSDVSTGVSAARFAMNPTPLGAAGLVGGAMLGGKGGGGGLPVAGGKPGAFTIDGKPWQDQNKYMVKGDNGTYDVMSLMAKRPMVDNPNYGKAVAGGTLNLGNMKNKQVAMNDQQLGEYITKQMGNDQTAINNFNKTFQVNTPVNNNTIQAKMGWAKPQATSAYVGLTPSFGSTPANGDYGLNRARADIRPALVSNLPGYTDNQWQFFTPSTSYNVAPAYTPTTQLTPIGGLASLTAARSLRGS